jgi:hypothetical protein
LFTELLFQRGQLGQLLVEGKKVLFRLLHGIGGDRLVDLGDLDRFLHGLAVGRQGCQ